MRRGKIYNLKVRSVILLDILKMSKAIDLFNLILMKLLLEDMLNLMKLSWSMSLIWISCHLRPTSYLQHFFHLLFLFCFLLQMMIMMMKIHLHLLTILEMIPLNMNLHQHHCFPEGSIQHKKQPVIFSVIHQINIEHIHS
jgi:hypothetical protein